MKRKLNNIQCKATMLWWLLTRRYFYVISFAGKKGLVMETYNVILPEFCEWLKRKHGYTTHAELIQSLKNAAHLTDDTLTRKQLIDIIDKLEEEYKLT